LWYLPTAKVPLAEHATITEQKHAELGIHQPALSFDSVEYFPDDKPILTIPGIFSLMETVTPASRICLHFKCCHLMRLCGRNTSKTFTVLPTNASSATLVPPIRLLSKAIEHVQYFLNVSQELRRLTRVAKQSEETMNSTSLSSFYGNLTWKQSQWLLPGFFRVEVSPKSPTHEEQQQQLQKFADSSSSVPIDPTQPLQYINPNYCCHIPLGQQQTTATTTSFAESDFEHSEGIFCSKKDSQRPNARNLKFRPYPPYPRKPLVALNGRQKNDWLVGNGSHLSCYRDDTELSPISRSNATVKLSASPNRMHGSPRLQLTRNISASKQKSYSSIEIREIRHWSVKRNHSARITWYFVASLLFWLSANLGVSQIRWCRSLLSREIASRPNSFHVSETPAALITDSEQGRGEHSSLITRKSAKFRGRDRHNFPRIFDINPSRMEKKTGSVVFSILARRVQVMEGHEIEQLPAEFSDNTQLYHIMDSSDILDSYQTYENYSFLYGIDDNEDEDGLSSCSIVDVSFLSCQADDDSLIFSVSACSDHDVTLDADLDDLSNVFSISSLDCSGLAVVEHSTTRFFIYDDDDDMSSDLSLSFSITPVMPADVEVMPSQPRRSLRIAAMKPVCYKKFF
jgi:hypothetical protein